MTVAAVVAVPVVAAAVEVQVAIVITAIAAKRRRPAVTAATSVEGSGPVAIARSGCDNLFRKAVDNSRILA